MHLWQWHRAFEKSFALRPLCLLGVQSFFIFTEELMPQTRSQFLERLLQGYSSYYDVTRMEETEAPLAATAFFHVHSAQYIVFKEAEVWSANCNEYIYVFDVPVLTDKIAAECIARAEKDGIPRVKPGKGHMSSFVDAVFVCDECTPEGLKVLKKHRNRKSFHYSLHGWMEVHTAAVDLGKGTVAGNYSNTEAVNYLKSVLHGRKGGAFKKIRMFLDILKN